MRCRLIKSIHKIDLFIRNKSQVARGLQAPPVRGHSLSRVNVGAANVPPAVGQSDGSDGCPTGFDADSRDGVRERRDRGRMPVQ